MRNLLLTNVTIFSKVQIETIYLNIYHNNPPVFQIIFCSYILFNVYNSGHSMSDHPMLETVPPQILLKIYTFRLRD